MRRPVILVVAAALALSACSSAGPSSTSPGTSPATSGSAAAQGALTVFAASSLKEAFTAIGKAFEAANRGVSVTFNFGPSSTLATQIGAGAPADVFASASGKTMDTVAAAGLAPSRSNFATNSLEIATPPASSVAISSLADLAKPGVKVAVCQQAVPCGAGAQTLFTKNSVQIKPVTEEVDVKSVLAKVELGEVDAGIVYVTDVQAAGAKVVGVVIPADHNVTNKYPIAAIKGSANAATAQAFVAFVLSPAGQAALASAGFAAP